MPTNSDVVLIISQYEKALLNFKNNYYFKDKNDPDKYGNYYDRWSTKENPILEADDEEDEEDE